MTFALAHTVHAREGARPRRLAVLLHGIMGSQRNWRGFARSLVENHPDWRVVTVDLRNHGASGPAPDPQTLEACVHDLELLCETIGRPELVSGHSFGGKVALEWAARHPEGLRSVWVLDCPPGLGRAEAHDEGEGELARVLSAVESLPMPVERRGAVLDALVERGLSRPLASWMSTNLRKNDDGTYSWTFDPQLIRAMIADYWRRDYYPQLERAGAAGPRYRLVQAGRSDRWTREDLDHLDRLDSGGGPVTVHLLPGAGHWLHVDDPEGLLALLEPDFLAPRR